MRCGDTCHAGTLFECPLITGNTHWVYIGGYLHQLSVKVYSNPSQNEVRICGYGLILTHRLQNITNDCLLFRSSMSMISGMSLLSGKVVSLLPDINCTHAAYQCRKKCIGVQKKVDYWSNHWENQIHHPSHVIGQIQDAKAKILLCHRTCECFLIIHDIFLEG